MSFVWRLPFPLLLALRYLRSTRKDAFVSFLSAVAAGGIGLGVAALVLALSALGGLQQALRGEVLARTPHLEIELPHPGPSGDGGQGAAALQERLLALPGVVHVQEAVHGRGWLESAGLVQTVDIVGYSGLVPRFFPGAEGGAPGLYISNSLATRWAVHPGDVMSVVSPRSTLTPLGPQPRIRSLPLTGTFESGRTEDVERIALPVAVARPLAGNPATFLEVTAGDLDAALALVPAVRALLPRGAELRTWEQLNRPLFFALRLEKSVMFVAVSLIVLVAAMALVADLALVITSKRAELGMLATMGATPQRLRRAFLWLGLLIAGLGTAAGAALGCGVALFLDHYRLVRLPGQIYFLDYLPFRLDAPDVAAVLAVTLTLALASALWVAQRVARLSPVEAMRR
ncbi:MAG TPA: FtsX-like permease family protein [Thermoanaerobaculia bacterium]|nr:FtsX-like permease family protein [Thermoanaerobaculia bacterium]